MIQKFGDFLCGRQLLLKPFNVEHQQLAVFCRRGEGREMWSAVNFANWVVIINWSPRHTGPIILRDGR